MTRLLAVATWIIRYRGRSRRAQATVEFAMVCLFGLLPMIFGTIEIGRGVWYYNQLSQLSREGARWLVVTHRSPAAASFDPVSSTFTDPGNSPSGDVTYSSVAACACPGTAVGWIGQMDIGIPTDQMRVRIRRDDNLDGLPWTDRNFVHGLPVYVEVSYPYQPIVTSLLNIPATITIRAATVMQME